MLVIERAETVIMRAADKTLVMVNRAGLRQTCGKWYQDNVLDALWSEWERHAVLACWLSDNDQEMQVWCPSCWSHPLDLMNTADALDSLFRKNGTTKGIDPERACKELQYMEA